ncbi:MAG: 23S rRNA (uracil(1939)-C(5))-methyltransferase RlmD [Bacteroidetes bacterium]|nr:MAG: 23S rRNA (uracil(1939)-C(5))-methyltransferase RlmD [Bacteroidota bacterium]
MLRKRKQLPFFEKVKITDIGSEGKAIAKINDLIVFIPFVIPGDIVDIQINKKKKNFLEGYAVKFHEYSPNRQEAFCSHFGICGGCKWQILPYEDQLKFKQKQVVDNLERIGKIELKHVINILPSEKTTYYRNKLEYSFSNKRWLTNDEIDDEGNEIKQMNALGFHIPKKFDKILDIEHCYLQKEPSNEIRLSIKKYALANNLTFFDLRKQTGFLRNIIIRTSTTNELMVIVSFFYEDKKEREKLLTHLSENFKEITSLMYVINSKPNDSITDLEVKLFKGKDHIFEVMENLKFKIGPKSFYQTNSEQAYNLYKIVREFADLSGTENVYDLYTGTGTIANFVANKSKKVIGIEYVKEAIDDAKINSEINSINNTEFFAGDMKDILSQEFIDKKGKPDVIIIDPPRAGMHKNVIESLLYAMPKKIVYVSCNPATQARDINLLLDNYSVEKIQPVDMFPHTHHVENVALLKLKTK